jgi:hypothetical protein
MPPWETGFDPLRQFMPEASTSRICPSQRCQIDQGAKLRQGRAMRRKVGGLGGPAQASTLIVIQSRLSTIRARPREKRLETRRVRSQELPQHSVDPSN